MKDCPAAMETDMLLRWNRLLTSGSGCTTKLATTKKTQLLQYIFEFACPSATKVAVVRDSHKLFLSLTGEFE
jgi:hypothetical protein